MKRRPLLLGGTLAPVLAASLGCSRSGGGRVAGAPAHDVEVRWVGASHERGHRLHDVATMQRAAAAWPAPARRAGALVLGAGVAGLAAARAFRRAGVDDVHVLELEDAAGGNARAHAMAGTACPLGAHYLPLPGPEAHEVREWLHEIGLLATDAAGRVRADERHLAHSPQERLFFEGQWVEGLLPPAAPGSPRLAQYRRFAALVADVRRAPGGARPRRPGQGDENGTGHRGGRGGRGADRARPAFALPAHRSAWTPELAALDAMTFAQWLAREGLHDAALLAHLDYCCRDDYGAGPGVVSAWAGLHYFASRHGFTVPGDGDPSDLARAHDGSREAVLTWPEGNAWLTRRLAEDLGAERLHAGQVVLGVREERHRVAVLALDARTQALAAWEAPVVVVALPLLAARRIVQPAAAELKSALDAAAGALTYAPWLVANLLLDKPLLDRGIGAPAAWDNVVHGARGLGYVDATHQRLGVLPAPAPVLTAYHALPAGERAALLGADARPWAERVFADLEAAHPDLRQRVQRIDLMRYGHAMAVPRPGLQRHPGLVALRSARGRLRFAHSDLAGYSVFEEAFIAGTESAGPGRRRAGG